MARKSNFAARAAVIMAVVCCGWVLTVDGTKSNETRGPESSVTKYNINVNISAVRGSCDKKFLSIAIDISQARNKFSLFNFSSIRLQNLAKALSPGYVRLGGSDVDFAIFDPDAPEGQWNIKSSQTTTVDKETSASSKIRHRRQARSNFILSGKQWVQFTTFTSRAQLDLMLDLNVFLRQNGEWDPTNAKSLLNYSDARDIDIKSFQLGNEPQHYLRVDNISITPSALVKDYITLRNVLSNYTRYNTSAIYGPSVSNPGSVNAGPTVYLRGFFQADGPKHVTAVDFHHYYKGASGSTPGDFFSSTLLDSLKNTFNIVSNLTQLVNYPVDFIISETSSMSGGGVPNLSNAYAAGAMFLDKLGLSALFNLKRLFRQSFIAGSYALISSGCVYEPYPDYWLAVLFKRLIEGPVFEVIASPPLGELRAYAHCARRDVFSYPAGALAIYYINLNNESVVLSFAQFPGKERHIFILTPGDDGIGIYSKTVKLNGQILQLVNDELPVLQPSIKTGDITVGAQTFGFIVIPKAGVQSCKDYVPDSVE